jgi:hypothetical protein
MSTRVGHGIGSLTTLMSGVAGAVDAGVVGDGELPDPSSNGGAAEELHRRSPFQSIGEIHFFDVA